MTKIEWTDETENPLKRADGGNFCKLISSGCVNCYASLLNSRGTRFGGNGLAYGGSNQANPKMTLNTDMLTKWARMRKPKKHFIGSMTDIFGEWVPDVFLFELFNAMANAPLQTFQLLTKRPERMYRFVNHWINRTGIVPDHLGNNRRRVWPQRPPNEIYPRPPNEIYPKLPANVWLGTSAEDQQRLDERLIWLIRAKAQVRFLSLEPLLGSITLPGPDSDTALMMQDDDPKVILYPIEMIDWIIIGGESGSKARPLELAWIVDVLEQCQQANIPAFVKQLGSHWAKQAGANDSKGGNPDEWAEVLRVRMFPGDEWPKQKPSDLWEFWR